MAFNIDYNDMSKLINISIATANLNSIRTESSNVRTPMHLLTWGRIGGGKSSMLFKISKEIKRTPYNDLTKATILGAVDKNTGIFIPPAVWLCRNSVLLIDEFHIDKFDSKKRDLLNSLLMLLEYAEITKPIGYRCNNFEEKDGELFCKIKDNTIRCKTKFVFFANTMMNLNKTQMQELIALKSRCVVVPYNPSINELIEKIKGKEHYNYSKYEIKKKDVFISKKIEGRFLDILIEHKISEIDFMRTFGDMCRVYAVVGYKKNMFDLLCELKEI